MTIQDITHRLVADGWKRWPDYLAPESVCFFKRFAATPCHLNEGNGIQVKIAASQFKGQASIELDVIAELPDSTWIQFKNYSFGDDINAVLNAIPRLIACWEMANEKTACRSKNAQSEKQTP